MVWQAHDDLAGRASAHGVPAIASVGALTCQARLYRAYKPHVVVSGHGWYLPLGSCFDSATPRCDAHRAVPRGLLLVTAELSVWGNLSNQLPDSY